LKDSYFLDTMNKINQKNDEDFQSEEFHCPVEATFSLIGGIQNPHPVEPHRQNPSFFGIKAPDPVRNAEDADAAAS